jgi:putative alpha-1,2-mannosidase
MHGQHSGTAWFVMSAMGLFQIDGGCRVNSVYEIGSPLYPKITIHLSEKYYGGKTLVIEARRVATNRTTSREWILSF